jgi:hypothetical protein
MRSVDAWRVCSVLPPSAFRVNRHKVFQVDKPRNSVYITFESLEVATAVCEEYR